MTMPLWDVESVLRVVRGKGGFWEVRALRLTAPLFHFRTRQDAKSYAEDIAQAHPGISVEVCGENWRVRGTDLMSDLAGSAKPQVGETCPMSSGERKGTPACL